MNASLIIYVFNAHYETWLIFFAFAFLQLNLNVNRKKVANREKECVVLSLLQ